MAQPSTPQQNSLFGPTFSSLVSASAGHDPNTGTPASSLSPASVSMPSSAASSSNNTYIMPNSPVKNRGSGQIDGYRPKVTRTLGQRPSCLVNASVTYCGNNQIYAFGGFDQFTDEVYNHVLRLDLLTHQWSLVNNYGDIPGVRMGHTATLWQGDKLLVFGGENEHRAYLSDLIIFDLKTAYWTQPQVSGSIPTGRARHAAVLHEDRLFVIGGITGSNNYVLDDICYLDLKTFTWSRSWRFVSRFDHSAHIHEDKVWVFGGLSADMDKNGDLWWLDLKGVPAFESPPQVGVATRQMSTRLTRPYPAGSGPVGTSGYAANSRTAQVNPPSFQVKSYCPVAPGAISALKFVSGPGVPSQGLGFHFHAWTSGSLLDFMTPNATASSRDCSLSSLDLDSLKWQQLARGYDVFKAGYRWHYCTMNPDGTKAWLLGCPMDGTLESGPNGIEECLSDIMEIDLRRYGFLGNPTSKPDRETNLQSALRTAEQPSKGLGADLARLLDKPPETGSGTDFIITALPDLSDNDPKTPSSTSTDAEHDQAKSQPIHVHRFILQARWPYFDRMINAHMREFHTKKLHITEQYSVVKAFLHYLYTDTIHAPPLDNSDRPSTTLTVVAGLLLMSNIYHVPHLRLLCVNCLNRELDVDHACIIWFYAGLAGEGLLRRRAAAFCMTHWGRVVRTQGFLSLPRSALVELSQEADTEGRVIGGDELDMVGDLDGTGLGVSHRGRKASVSSQSTQLIESDDEGMDLN